MGGACRNERQSETEAAAQRSAFTVVHSRIAHNPHHPSTVLTRNICSSALLLDTSYPYPTALVMGASSSRSQAALVLALLSSPFITAYVRRRSKLYHSTPLHSRFFYHPPLPPPTVPSTSPTPSAHFLSTPHLITRLLYHILPIPLQHYVRDRGLLQLSNVLALLVGPFVYVLPYSARLLFEHMLPSNQPLRVRYSPASQLTVEVHNAHRRLVADAAPLSPIVVFTHGGAWGSGNALMYRLLSTCFDGEMHCVTFTHNYHTYPTADVVQQIGQLRQLLVWLAENGARYGGDVSKVILVGHSSGAHLTVLHLLTAPSTTTPSPSSAFDGHDAFSPFAATERSEMRVVGAVGLSGAYDIAAHYVYESRRGVHEVSPMKPACHEPAHFDDHSPTCIAQQRTAEVGWTVPPLLLVHGDRDETVPDLESRRLCEAMGGTVRRLAVTVEGRRMAEVEEWEAVGSDGGACECVIYADGDHGCTMLSLMTRTGSHLIDTLRTFIHRCLDESTEAERRQCETAASMQLEQLRLLSRL